uniref:Transient receptor potential cation channel subfamily M member 2 n=1 Tax=Sus scrofa TaxID=9823 RepID=A0A8D0SPN2_PIG
RNPHLSRGFRRSPLSLGRSPAGTASTFRSASHLGFIFGYHVKEGSKFFFLLPQITTHVLKWMPTGSGLRRSLSEAPTPVLFPAASRSHDGFGHENWDHQLKLAVAWNRVDIARSEIFTDERVWGRELHPMMTAALIANKPEFVKLFLENGVQLTEFGTCDTLLYLYENLEPCCLFRYKLQKVLAEEPERPAPRLRMHHVAQVLRELLGDFSQPLYPRPRSSDQPRLLLPAPNLKFHVQGVSLRSLYKRSPRHVAFTMDPVRDLLLWAIVQNRRELAEIIWAQSQDCIAAALACSKILKQLSREEEDTDSLEEMLALADEYEQRAIGVFTECYRKDEERAQKLLVRVSEAWGKTTCLQLALEAKDMKFVSHGGVQAFLTKVWWGQLSVDNGLWRVVLCMLAFPLLATGLVSFRCPPGFTVNVACFLRDFLFYFILFYFFVFLLFLWAAPSAYGVLFLSRVSLLLATVVNFLFGFFPAAFCSPGLGPVTCNDGDHSRSPSWRCPLLGPRKCSGRGGWIPGGGTCQPGVRSGSGPPLAAAPPAREHTWVWTDPPLWVSLGPEQIAEVTQRGRRPGPWGHRQGPWRCRVAFPSTCPLPPDAGVNFNLDQCSPNGTDPYKPKCPESDSARQEPAFPEWLTVLLLCLYLLFTNILLLNLLIAMFNYTFQQVQERTDQIWKFQRHGLIEEYEGRPPAPPPFILLNHLHLCLQRVVLKNPSSERHKPFKSKLEKNEEAALLSWEMYLKENYLQDQQSQQKQRPEQKIQDTSEKVDTMVDLLEMARLKQSGSVEQRLASLEEQVAQMARALHWVVRALRDSGFGSEEGVPTLAPQQASEGQDPELDDGQRVEDPGDAYHVNARHLLYPNSPVLRFPVPNEKVPWETEFLIYDPPFYSADRKDKDLVDPVGDTWEPLSRISFNAVEGHLDRRSFHGAYALRDGFPLNPMGRTGLRGRGDLVCFGPNHTLQPVITRWKRNQDGAICRKSIKKMLEVLVVKCSLSEHWALPGGSREPGETLPRKLKQVLRHEFWASFENLLRQGAEVYKGYVDDPRNTDNAWIETVAVSIHFADQSDLELKRLNSHLCSRDPGLSIRWQLVDRRIPLYANHKAILRKAAALFGAYY